MASVWLPKKKLNEAVEKLYPSVFMRSIIVVFDVLFTTFYQI